MRLKNVKNASVTIENSNYVIKNPNIYKGKWNEVLKEVFLLMESWRGLVNELIIVKI